MALRELCQSCSLRIIIEIVVTSTFAKVTVFPESFPPEGDKEGVHVERNDRWKLEGSLERHRDSEVMSDIKYVRHA